MQKKRAAAVILATSVLLEVTYITAWAAGPTFQRLFELSDAQLGVCLGATSLGAIVMAPLAGYIVHRWGAFPVLVAGLLTLVVSIALVMLSSGFVSLVGSLAVMGIAVGLIPAANTSQLADLFPGSVRRIMALASALWFGSSAISFPLIGRWLDVARARGWQTWGFRAPYLLELIGAAVCVALVAVLVRPVATPPGGAHVRAEPSGADAPALRADGTRQWLWLPLLGFGHGLMIVTVLSWVNPMAQARFHVGNFAGAMLQSGISLGQGSGRLLLASVRREWDELRLLLMSSLAGAFIFAVGLLMPTYALALPMFAVGGLASAATFPCILSLIGNRFPMTKAKVFGYTSGSIAAAGILGPALVGWLAQDGVPIHLALGVVPAAGIILAVASLRWLLQDRRRGVKELPPSPDGRPA